MYPWQSEAVALGRAAGSLVYTAPTGAGKSRVADELLFEALRENSHGKALVIVPYIALVREKVATLNARAAGEPRTPRARGYAGGDRGQPLRGGERIAVVTMEKALGVIHRAIERDDLGTIAMIVVDELHCVGESGRGDVLERALSEVRHACSSARMRGHEPRIVAMTATVGTRAMMRLASWLGAATYACETRAVELRERVACRSGVYEKQGNDLARVGECHSGNEADVAEALAMEVFVQGHGSLVFCSSRAGCEDLARRMAYRFRDVCDARSRAMREACAQKLFAASEGAPNPSLVECVSSGVAWHHSGLTSMEKFAIEEGFRVGAILALCCTSTLAAGVNLPARRVIIRPDEKNLTMSQYRQMAGRAGRKGHSDVGESFLLLPAKNLDESFLKAREWVCGELPALESQLFPMPRGGAAASTSISTTPEQRRFFLDSISCGATRSHEDTFSLIMSTYAWTSEVDGHRQEVVRIKDEALKAIHDEGLARVVYVNNGESKEWIASPEGYSFYKCTLPIAHARDLRLELERAVLNGLRLTTKTHLLFFCVPPKEGNIFFRRLNWSLWFDVLENDVALHEFSESHLNITRAFARKMLIAPAIRADALANVNKHERLAAALLLGDILRAEETIAEIRERWLPFCENLNAGEIQRLQASAAATAGMASILCEECDWLPLADLLSNMSLELQAGAKQELVPLMTIEGMTGARARMLYDAGFTTPKRIVKLGIDNVDKLSAAVLKSLAKSSKLSVGFDQAARTAAWRIANQIFSNAQQLAIEEARTAANDGFVVPDLNEEKRDVAFENFTRERELIEKSKFVAA